jgi:putative redox protein
MSNHVSATWKEALEFRATDADGAEVGMGTAVDEFGPAALVLAALGGCTGMDVVSIMSKKKVAFDSYRLDVTGEQRQAYPRIYTSIAVEHVLTGSAIDDKAVSRSIELSARKYCVVGATLASGATVIEHRMRITDEDGERSSDCLTVGPQGEGLSRPDGA